MKSIIPVILTLLLAGCDGDAPSRNNPADQVADYAVCLSGGMVAGTNTYGEVKCLPPAVQPVECRP